MPSEVEDHKTRHVVNGETFIFKYPDAISIHSKTKHAVDDINNWHHDPISFFDGWQTWWWPNHQFTFFLSVTEVNAINSQAQACKMSAEPQLQFCKNLVKFVMHNKLNEDGKKDPHLEPERKCIHQSCQRELEHMKMTSLNFKTKWNGKQWKGVKTKHC